MIDPILAKIEANKTSLEPHINTTPKPPTMTNFLDNISVAPTSSPIVIAEKDMFIGSIHGFAENGGETPIEQGWALRFVRTSDKFIRLQLLSYGKGVKPKTQFWAKKSSRKPKATEVKKTQTKIGIVEEY